MLRLPDFPWDSLAPARERASAFADPDIEGPAGRGIVDLSVGTPVDPTPEVVRAALTDAADAPGYPQTWGTPDLREAVAAWFATRRGVPDVDPDGVLPTIGSKELVAWLPTLLGLGEGDVVGFPRVAYPTYDVGARLAGAVPMPVDSLTALGPLTPGTTPRLLWLNSPSNPTGRVLGVEHLAKVVSWAREHGVLVASDECYAELDWRERVPGSGEPPTTPSVLDPRVCGGSHEGLLAVYSLSKQSNLAGYRAAFVAGDPAVVRELLEVRKHAGMILPWPVQRAMVAALADSAHVQEQRERYAARRAVLLPAVERFGLRVEDSDAGLYLWATAGEDGRRTLARLAERGVLVAPGDFYGPTGREYVRIALTASDERVAAAAHRLR
ncbi:succinyldiaminopimelate transaminase [Phycicoccus endophyticus]|uniref:Aminotransferase n=1 Tax=Phycicoccus endophyticus TaxID=1690220 RepID=A0A7G9QZ04_9MICO|nr:succinyldiaminopimelate transaminase [Phycicoccus endophyticus]NHI18917.1 succinyldiaminopimelate transaminase [Phycicoccus endophyticus]QNN48579.1 succinyldiaminopimelate transaminase [Phycicoccus endophyticus]GGL31370.1 succinyldiaminopimelate transaminase [Phycicoccus endophyticus]